MPHLQTNLEDESRPAEQLIHHVLACLDQSAFSEGVLSHALAIASAYGAEMTLFHALEPPGHPAPEPLDPVEWEIRRREAGSYLQAVAGRTQSDVPVRLATELAEGDPVTQIRRRVEEGHVDLVVFCTHGRKGSTEWPLASTARKLVDVLRCSLLVVPPALSAPAHKARYRHVLVPLDGSAWAASAIPFAARIAEQHDAEIILVHTVVKPELIASGPHTAEDAELERRVVERNERAAREHLEQVQARLTAGGLTVRAIVERNGGARYDVLRVIARENPDLVVFSARGASAHADSACGSVALRLLADAAKPSLMLRTPRENAVASLRMSRRATASRLPAQAGP